MGLDITAYSGMKRINATLNEDHEAIDDATGQALDYHDYCVPYDNPYFPGRVEGVEGDKVYSFEKSMGFRAGSYSGYGWWRGVLSAVAGAPDAPGKPFFELVMFSDCEGSIGPVVSAKLAKDFADFQGKVDALPKSEDFEYFQQLYGQWRKAFEMAAQGGMVDFH